MEYFKCSEIGLKSESPVGAEPLKLVIAEALPGHGSWNSIWFSGDSLCLDLVVLTQFWHVADANNNQVESFIKYHEGPGIQHIGLLTEDIVSAAAFCKEKGVDLQTPPMMYYSHVNAIDILV